MALGIKGDELMQVFALHRKAGLAKAWWLLPLLATDFSAGACGRGLFGISSSEHQDAATAEVDPNPVPAGLSVCFPDHPPSCDETCRQATRVLWQNCAKCHGDSRTAVGLPPWDFVMDPQRLTTVTWAREGVPAMHFVLPGDPANSAVYRRAVIARDMPPIYGDLSSPRLSRVSEADGQILNDWIGDCLGASRVDAGVPPPPPDAAPLIPPSAVVCPAAPSTGACPVEHQYCLYPSQTCLCSGGTWQCLACPAQQPAIGASCAPAPGLQELLTFRCGYGSVSCFCDRRLGGSELWGCGVCPIARPGDGTACGNSSFSCAYGNDTCSCVGNNWLCVTEAACPEPPIVLHSFDPAWGQCRGTRACSYPSEAQACACGARGGQWDCSCPAALPAEGSACVPVFSPPPCSYGDRTCGCDDNGWHCTATCPTVRPVAGDACGSTLSCLYDGGLCYCDGSHWQCS